MINTRPAAVAGAFYPADPRLLADEVSTLLDGASRAAGNAPHTPPPKAIIAPHAGYIYSGPIAASIYARLAPLRDRVRRVVLIGPAHRVWIRGLALPGVAAFGSPLGEVRIDADAVALIQGLPQVSVRADAHEHEHCLEVQLPFLQAVLGSFRLVPLLVGDASPAEVAEVLDTLWGGEETLVVVSSDLSHYLTQRAARTVDAATAHSIVALQPVLDHHQACGAAPINGLIELARRRHLAVEQVDLRNSGDTAGDAGRVVGYGAFAFCEAGHA